MSSDKNPTTIAIQGIAGCFHHEAAMGIFGRDINILPCHSFDQVFKAVESGKADSGVVAIENTLQGSINQTYRLLARSKLHIIAELYLRVDQYLIGSSHSNANDHNAPGTKIYSMFPSFAQTELWLEAHLPLAERIDYYDNAAAVEKIVKDGDPSELAIAGKFASDMYSATIISGPINDEPNNTTRFFALSKNPEPIATPNKTSIILRLTADNKPGALYRALGVFESRNINLSKLASYPIAGTDWHYDFYIDFDAASADQITIGAIKDLESQNCQVRTLGTYKSHKVS